MSRILLAAARSGDIAKVAQQLREGAAKDCVEKRTGRTPLIESVIAGHREVARTLIEAGANVNHCDTAVGYTPLLWACYNGDLQLANDLLEAGAEVNFRELQAGWTPLLWAARQSLPLVERLLEAGADLHASMSDGRTALAIAEAAKKTVIAAALRQRGCREQNVLPEPARLPWPNVGEEVEWVDFTRPESVVRGLIVAMNRFELQAGGAPSGQQRLPLMNAVFDRFCTPKRRPYGRNGSYQIPPEYDPDAEYLINSALPKPGRAEIITRNGENPYGKEYLYVLLKKSGRWLVDSKKYRSVGGEWNPWQI